MESISILGRNANNSERFIRLEIKKGVVSISELKQKIINSFYVKKVIPNIKDLILIKNLDNAPQKTHQIGGVPVYVKEDFDNNENLFSQDHENEDAYTVFKENNITTFFFLAQMES